VSEANKDSLPIGRWMLEYLTQRQGLQLLSAVVNLQRTWSPTGKARGTSMLFGGIRRNIPSFAQGFGGLSSSHSSMAIGRACTPKCLPSAERSVQLGVSARRRGLLRRRLNFKFNNPSPFVNGGYAYLPKRVTGIREDGDEKGFGDGRGRIPRLPSL
jgi:hypothetical protein